MNISSKSGHISVDYSQILSKHENLKQIQALDDLSKQLKDKEDKIFHSKK